MRNPAAGHFDGVVLDVWEELRGTLVGVREQEGYVVVELSVGAVRVPADSVAAEYLQSELEGMEGVVVGVVRTDGREQPYRVSVGPRGTDV